MKGADFSVNGKDYTIHYFKGQVADVDKKYETKVSGGGGGGYVHEGSVVPGAFSVNSTTIVHDTIYIQQADGKERVFELEDWNVACRKGNEVIMTWITQGADDKGVYAAFRNISTERMQYKSSALESLAGQPGYFIRTEWLAEIILPSIFMFALGFFVGLLPAFAIVSFLHLPDWLTFVVAMGCGALSLNWWMKYKKKKRNQFRERQDIIKGHLQTFLNRI